MHRHPEIGEAFEEVRGAIDSCPYWTNRPTATRSSRSRMHGTCAGLHDWRVLIPVMDSRYEPLADQRVFGAGSRETLKGPLRHARVVQASVLAAAMASFLSPEGADRREAAIARRLDKLTNQFERLTRDQTILIETLALFIRYQLSVTAPLPSSSRGSSRPGQGPLPAIHRATRASLAARREPSQGRLGGDLSDRRRVPWRSDSRGSGRQEAIMIGETRRKDSAGNRPPIGNCKCFERRWAPISLALSMIRRSSKCC